MWKRLLVGIMITILVLYAYIRIFNVNLDVFFKLPPWAIVASIALLFLSDFIRSVRLKIISKGVNAELGMLESYLIWEASRLMAMLTPGFYGGEVVRIGYIAKKYDVGKAVAINILETTSEAVGIAVNAIVSFNLLYFMRAHINLAPLVFPVVIAIFEGILATIVPSLKCPKIFGEKVYRYCLKVEESIEKAGYGVFGVAVLASTLGVAVYALSYGVIAQALDGVGTLATMVFASSLPLTIIPITPGGIGLPESACTLALPILASSLAVWRIVSMTITAFMSITSITLIGGLKFSLSESSPVLQGLKASGKRPSLRRASNEP